MLGGERGHNAPEDVGTVVRAVVGHDAHDPADAVGGEERRRTVGSAVWQLGVGDCQRRLGWDRNCR